MLVERIQGGWSIAEVVGGYLERRRFFGFTKKEAIKAFRKEFYLHPLIQG